MADRWLHCPICQDFTRVDEAKDLKKTFCSGCGRLFTQADVVPREGWTYAQNRQKIGPLSLDQLQQRAATGQLQPTDMVLEPGKTRWVAASTLAGLLPKAPATVSKAPRSATPVPPAKHAVAVEPVFVDPVVISMVPAKPVQPILVEPVAVEPVPPAAVIVAKTPATMKAVAVEPILVEPADLFPPKSTAKAVEPILVDPVGFSPPTTPAKPVKPILVEPIFEDPRQTMSMTPAASASPVPAPIVPAPVTPTPVVNVSQPVAPKPSAAPAPPVTPPLPPSPAPAPSVVPAVPPPAAAPVPVASSSPSPPPPGVAAPSIPTSEPVVPAPPQPTVFEPIFVEPEVLLSSPTPPVTSFSVTPVAVEPILVEPELPPMARPEVTISAPPIPIAPSVEVDVSMSTPVPPPPVVELPAPPPPKPPRDLGWFYVRYGQKLGPATLKELHEMVTAGQLWPTDMVMKEETEDWQPAGNVPGLFAAEAKTAQPTAAAPTVVPAAPTASATPQAESWPTVPGYEIHAEVHRGERWVIYKAQHLQLKKILALKMLRPDREFTADELVRIRKGADASARLRHPGIVPVEAVGEIEGRPYLALKFIEGKRLDERLIGLPQPARSAARLVQLLAEAVDYAHERGVVHGDLRPAQVLLAESPDAARVSDHGQPKITGFGTGGSLDRATARTDSFSYVAPEQVAAHAENSGRSAEVYSLGMILYELLTGLTPFRGATVDAALDLVATLEPVPPRRLQPSVPLDLDTICQKCLQKHPDLRYASAGALAEDLRRFLAGERISARPLLLLVRGVNWARQHPRDAAVAALVLLLFAMILGRNISASRQSALALNDVRERAASEAKALDEARKALEESTGALATQSNQRQKAEADLENYRKVCAAMVEQLRQAPDQELTYTVLWTCVLDARSGADPAQTLEAAEKLVAANPKCPPRFLVLRGAALYRAGRFDDALQRLNEALLAQPEPPAPAWLFLAMTHHRLNHADDARFFLDKATKWIDEKASTAPSTGLTYLELDLLRREAEGVIRGK